MPIWFSYATGRKAPRGVGKGRGGKQEHITLEAPEKERETGGEGLLATEVWEMHTEPKATAVRAGARRVAAMPAIVSLFPWASSSCFSLRNNTNNASPITHKFSLSLSISLSRSLSRALSLLSRPLVSLDKVSKPGWKRRRWMFIRPSVGPSVRRSVRPSVRPSVGPSVRRSVRPSVRPSWTLNSWH